MIRKSISLAVLVLVLAGAWLGVRGVLAYRHLTSARAQLATAKTELLDHRLPEARTAVAKASKDTRSARSLTGDPVWRVAAAVPFAGGSLAAAADIARTADDVARQVLPAALQAADHLDPSTLRAPDGTVRLAQLTAAKPGIAAASAAADRLKLPEQPAGAIAPVARAYRQLKDQAASLKSGLTGAKQGLDLAPALLGADKPRRYFVLVQQTSEARGTGGLPGGFAVLEADKGHLRISAQGSDADIHMNHLAVPQGVPADFVKRYEQLGSFDLWVNINVSPDLPVVSRLVAQAWKQQSGQTIDGVIALDSQALADLLRGTPPLPIVGGKQLKPADIVDYLAVGQYRDFAAPDSQGGIDRSVARKQLLVQIAKAATTRLVSGGGSTLDLLKGLADAVDSGHLRMASDDPALHDQLHAAHRDGALPDGPAPVAYPVLFNSTGGKLDYFLDRSIHYTAGSCDKPRRDSRIEVDLTNRAPTSGLPPYLTIRFEPDGITHSNVNRTTLTVYGTRGATLKRLTIGGVALGEHDFLTGTAEGLPLWSTLVELPPGQTQKVVLELSEPTAKGAARIPEQPLARPLTRTVDVPTCS